MTKEEFDSWVSDMYNKFDGEKQLHYSLDYEKGICMVYSTDTYESAVSKYDKSNGCIAITTTYAKLKGIEIPTIDEAPTSWKAKSGERYYYIHHTGIVEDDVETSRYFDDENYKFGNYFKTREQAESARKKIKHLLRLQRLHDMLCPDYEPDWSSHHPTKTSIIYHEEDCCYYPTNCYTCNNMSDVYFTEEAADKACEILNKEKEND